MGDHLSMVISGRERSVQYQGEYDASARVDFVKKVTKCLTPNALADILRSEEIE
jgi:hypothetical protein